MADDDLEIMDDEEPTLALDDDELALDDEDSDDEDEFGDVEDEDEDEDAGEEYAAAGDSGSIGFTAMLVLSCLAYATALAVIMSELRDYCDPDQFMFGLLK